VELEEVVKGRRSIRIYRDRDIPDDVIEELLDLARHAPSSMDGQPWHFIVIRNTTIKHKLAAIKNKYCPLEKITYKADFLLSAPVIIVVCVDKQKSYEREVENGVLATANIMLGAHNRGLGTVYMSAYRTNEPRIAEEIRDILGIPENIIPITVIPIGYPHEIPNIKTIRSLQETVSYETFSNK
jgi:nitroreductase